VNTIRRSLSRTTVGALLTGVFSIFNFFLLFYYSSLLALVATLLVAFAIVVVLSVGAAKLRYERKLSEVGGKLSSMIFQYLGGISKLRVVSAEGRAFANWATLFSRYRSLRFRAEYWEIVGETFLTGYSTLTIGRRVVRGHRRCPPEHRRLHRLQCGLRRIFCRPGRAGQRGPRHRQPGAGL
jgi:ABC-type bacteriocin/lantibiotic exporter with double-glycine peptidase domain